MVHCSVPRVAKKCPSLGLWSFLKTERMSLVQGVGGWGNVFLYRARPVILNLPPLPRYSPVFYMSNSSHGRKLFFYLSSSHQFYLFIVTYLLTTGKIFLNAPKRLIMLDFWVVRIWVVIILNFVCSIVFVLLFYWFLTWGVMITQLPGLLSDKKGENRETVLYHVWLKNIFLCSFPSASRAWRRPVCVHTRALWPLVTWQLDL